MPILFHYRNITHILGMYITKQAEQQIYVIAQESKDGVSPNKKKPHTLIFPAPCGCPSSISGVCWIAPDVVLTKTSLEMALKTQQEQRKERRSCEMMPAHHLQVSPCLIIHVLLM